MCARASSRDSGPILFLRCVYLVCCLSGSAVESKNLRLREYVLLQENFRTLCFSEMAVGMLARMNFFAR